MSPGRFAAGLWATITGGATLVGVALAWLGATVDQRDTLGGWLLWPVRQLFNVPAVGVVLILASLGSTAAVLLITRRRRIAQRRRGGRLLVRYDYQAEGRIVAVVFTNDGLVPVAWFTVEVVSESCPFDIGHMSDSASVSVSGLGGTFTTISGRDLLPGERGYVELSSTDGSELRLDPPKILTDAESAFAGSIRLEWGPEQRTAGATREVDQ